MSLLEVVREPNPNLHRKAREVNSEEFGPELSKQLSNMAETM